MLFQTGKQRWLAFFGSQSFGPIFAPFHDELVQRWIDRQRVIAVEAGEAKLVELSSGGANHAVNIKVTKAIDAEVITDLIQRHLIRY